MCTTSLTNYIQFYPFLSTIIYLDIWKNRVLVGT